VGVFPEIIIEMDEQASLPHARGGVSICDRLPGYLVFIVLSFLSATKIEELIDQHGELNAMGINYRN